MTALTYLKKVQDCHPERSEGPHKEGSRYLVRSLASLPMNITLFSCAFGLEGGENVQRPTSNVQRPSRRRPPRSFFIERWTLNVCFRRPNRQGSFRPYLGSLREHFRLPRDLSAALPIHITRCAPGCDQHFVLPRTKNHARVFKLLGMTRGSTR